MYKSVRIRRVRERMIIDYKGRDRHAVNRRRVNDKYMKEDRH
jgi:hypothetical protein